MVQWLRNLIMQIAPQLFPKQSVEAIRSKLRFFFTLQGHYSRVPGGGILFPKGQ